MVEVKCKRREGGLWTELTCSHQYLTTNKWRRSSIYFIRELVVTERKKAENKLNWVILKIFHAFLSFDLYDFYVFLSIFHNVLFLLLIKKLKETFEETGMKNPCFQPPSKTSKYLGRNSQKKFLGKFVRFLQLLDAFKNQLHVHIDNTYFVMALLVTSTFNDICFKK